MLNVWVDCVVTRSSISSMGCAAVHGGGHFTFVVLYCIVLYSFIIVRCSFPKVLLECRNFTCFRIFFVFDSFVFDSFEGSEVSGSGVGRIHGASGRLIRPNIRHARLAWRPWIGSTKLGGL
jgi:hypothetical protein